MIERNFHTHTSRCGHAVGTDEEYVQAAIQAGVKVLGFSDHAPYKDPEPTERMNIEQVDDYFSCIGISSKEKLSLCNVTGIVRNCVGNITVMKCCHCNDCN